MPNYVIERGVAGVGDSTPEELRALTQKSNAALDDMGGKVQWVHSYVTQDKIYCHYRADNAELVREHARRGGFPADTVVSVQAIIDPTTAEG
jgi:hypothetical protein